MPGALFSKVLLIASRKAVLFSFKIEVSIVSKNMIKQSVNYAKWTGFLARIHAFLIIIMAKEPISSRLLQVGINKIQTQLWLYKF